MNGLSLEMASSLLKTFAPVNSEKRLIKFLFLPISQDHKNKFLIFQDLRTSAFAINVFSSIIIIIIIYESLMDNMFSHIIIKLLC